MVGNDVLKVYQAKAAEAFPKESSLSLTGGVYVGPNGKLAYSGGIFGTFHNAISGGVTSGTAIGAASPIVFELAGNVGRHLR